VRHFTVGLQRRLRRYGFAVCTLVLIGVTSSAIVQAEALAQDAERDTLHLRYLGTAGWHITDGRTVVLVDPYLTRLGRRFFPNSWALTNDGVPLALLGDSVIVPDTMAIQARIDHADYVLVSHSHYDHLLDVPYIALHTGAKVIGTESTRNIARVHGVPDSQLITVHGGEDYDFATFSLRVVPSLHSALAQKHFFDPRVASRELSPPLRVRDYPEGGTLAFLIRMAGCQIFVSGSMNYIEREVMGLRPDLAIVGSTAGRRQIYDYTGRLLRALGPPPVVLPNHWDDETLPFTDPQARGGESILRALNAFISEVQQASPSSQVIVPHYFEPLTLLRSGAQSCRLIDEPS
jgi:L-ascorbate metabolism protein UlaG (beta-lactamase superfamily)